MKGKTKVIKIELIKCEFIFTPLQDIEIQKISVINVRQLS